PVAGNRAGAEEMSQRRETDAADAAFEQLPREPDRVDDGCRHAPPGQSLDLAVEKRHVEAGVVSDEDAVAGEVEESPHGEPGGRSRLEVSGTDPGEGLHCGRQRHARVDEGGEAVLELELPDALRPDLTDPRRRGLETRRLEVE